MPDGPDASTWRRVAGSMRARITLAATLVTGIAVALAGWLLIRSVEDTQLARLRNEAESSVDEVGDRLEDGEPLERAVWNIYGVQITDENGALLLANPMRTESGLAIFGDQPAETGAAAVSPGLPPEVLADVIEQRAAAGSGGESGGSGSGPGLAVFSTSASEIVSREVSTERWGDVVVVAGAPNSEVAETVEAVTAALWVLLPGLVGVVALVAWWLAGRTLRPVEAIRVQAESIGGSTIHRRLPEPAGDDEIGRLARTMNAMLERLEDSAVRQRQFVSDASHELRSPVAAIRTDLEVALHEGDAADWQTVARAVLAEESRLEALLGDLLVLASDDESAAAALATMVDVVQLAADEVARGRQVPVTLDAPADIDPEAFVVAGVPARLDRALANLVDNAARHARSEVRVAVSRHGARVRVVVDDDGPGIPAIDRERIFERFTRLDASRARHQGGAGLGLAVVRSIVSRHGGYVWADRSPLGGARFTFELPAAHP